MEVKSGAEGALDALSTRSSAAGSVDFERSDDHSKVKGTSSNLGVRDLSKG